MINSKNYITDKKSLEEVLALINSEKLVALDTEFMREKTYYPVLSLIQIAVKKDGEQKLFVVDAISDLDLKPLKKILFDKKIKKIFHASLQDLQIFCHESKISQADILNLSESIIDTQVMANFCGFDFNSGYSNLAEVLLNRKIDKTLQRSDWQKRPLDQEQLEYAISDVIFLEEIYLKLSEILVQKKRQEWYFEEMKIFVNKAISDSKENIFKNFSFKGRSIKQVARIKSLILWRESWAQKLDLPRQHFIRDHVIERMAYMQDIELINLDSQKISEIKQILEQEFGSDENYKTKEEGNFMTMRQKNLYKKSKELIAKIAHEENIKEQLLITSQNLKNLICSKKSVEELIFGWRYQLFGESLKKVISA